MTIALLVKKKKLKKELVVGLVSRLIVKEKYRSGPPIDQDNNEWISMPCVLCNPEVKVKACPRKEEGYQKQNKKIKKKKA